MILSEYMAIGADSTGATGTFAPVLSKVLGREYGFAPVLFGLRRLKSYLRNTMSQTRLNNIAVLNCHRAYLDTVVIDSILDEFITRCSVRQNTFAVNGTK